MVFFSYGKPKLRNNNNNGKKDMGGTDIVLGITGI
jgi:hypothetical protein